MEIEKQLKISRPNLSDSSIKTYTSLLQTVYNNIFKKDKINMTDFKNIDKILNHLKNIKPVTRKTILSALYVLTKNDDYKINMLEDIKENDIIQEKQEKTETQKNNWLETDKLNETLEELKNKALHAYKSKDYQTIQQYILIALLSGKYIPPRRAKDYTEFKIKNITANDNYIKGNKLYFNNYKGSDKKGTQIIEIPLELKRILTKWIKLNPNDYLFFDTHNNKLSNVTLNQRLNKIFGSKISVNAMRHTFLTDKHKDTIKNIDELKKDMHMMGSSIIQSKVYIKNDK
jgi:integrase